MKLLKKLLPLATVASTAAVIAPMVTSCGVVAGTSNFDWKPTEQHAEAKITTEAQYNELVKDYFSKPAHFANDFMYYGANMGAYSNPTGGIPGVNEIKAQKDSLEKQVAEKKLESYTMSFNLAVNSIKFKEYKELNLGESFGSQKVYGYVTDGSVSFELSSTQTFPETEGAKQSTEYKENINVSFSNVFAIINPDSKNIVAFMHKDLDWEYSMTATDIQKDIRVLTKNGVRIETLNQGKEEGKIAKKDQQAMAEYIVKMFVIESYYLETVTFNL